MQLYRWLHRENCSVDESNCDPNPCLNEGKCEDMINNYSCVCISPFTCRNCSIAIDGKHIATLDYRIVTAFDTKSLKLN